MAGQEGGAARSGPDAPAPHPPPAFPPRRDGKPHIPCHGETRIPNVFYGRFAPRSEAAPSRGLKREPCIKCRSRCRWGSRECLADGAVPLLPGLARAGPRGVPCGPRAPCASIRRGCDSPGEGARAAAPGDRPRTPRRFWNVRKFNGLANFAEKRFFTPVSEPVLMRPRPRAACRPGWGVRGETHRPDLRPRQVRGVSQAGPRSVTRSESGL